MLGIYANNSKILRPNILLNFMLFKKCSVILFLYFSKILHVINLQI